MGWGVLWLLLKHRRVVWLSISVMVSWRRDSDIQLIQFVRLINLLAKQAWLCCIYVDINNITNIISTETTNGNRQSLLDANNNKPCKIVGWTIKKRNGRNIKRYSTSSCLLYYALTLSTKPIISRINGVSMLTALEAVRTCREPVCTKQHPQLISNSSRIHTWIALSTLWEI